MSQITLCREIRFALSGSAAASANGFAGQPALTGIDPFLTLTAVLRGAIDTKTGMLINIKVVDRVLRDQAVRAITEYHRAASDGGGGDLLKTLLVQLREAMVPQELTGLRLDLSPFLALAIFSEDSSMVELSQRFEFAAAHRLYAESLTEAQNQDAFGRCTNANGHGHNYEVEVTVAGAPDGAGCVLAIPELQRIVNQHVIDVFDHKHLNLDCPEFRTLNPTVENIAQVVFGKLKAAFTTAKLKRVRVWETPKTYAEVSS